MNDDLTDLALIAKLSDTVKIMADAVKLLAEDQAQLEATITNLNFKLREIELNLNKHLRGVE